MRRLYTTKVTEDTSGFDWEHKRVRGGGSGTVDRLIVFAVLLGFCGALVTGVVGSVLYVVKTAANSHIRATSCKVMASTLIAQTCEYMQCMGHVDGQPNVACEMKKTDCYGLQWSVQFNQVDSEGEIMPNRLVSAWINEGTVKSTSEGARRLNTFEINKMYTCSYAAEDPNYVRWGYDDPQPWLIMMIVSWSIVGMFLCTMGFTWFYGKEAQV